MIWCSGSPGQVRDVLRLKTAGVAINEIARRVGVASSTVRLTLKRLAAAGLAVAGREVAGEEEHRGLHRHQAPGADVLQFHAAVKPTSPKRPGPATSSAGSATP